MVARRRNQAMQSLPGDAIAIQQHNNRRNSICVKVITRERTVDRNPDTTQ